MGGSLLQDMQPPKRGRILPAKQVGSPKKNADPYERNNRWALYSSLLRGISKTTLIAVWNNVGGRAKDRDEYLVQRMVDLMRGNGRQDQSHQHNKIYF